MTLLAMMALEGVWEVRRYRREGRSPVSLRRLHPGSPSLRHQGLGRSCRVQRMVLSAAGATVQTVAWLENSLKRPLGLQTLEDR